MTSTIFAPAKTVLNFILTSVLVRFWYQRLDGLADDDYVYAGASIPQIMGLDLTVPTGIDSKEVRLQRVQHYYAQVGLVSFFLEKGRLLSLPFGCAICQMCL